MANKSSVTRRDFLQTAGGVTAGVLLGGSRVPANGPKGLAQKVEVHSNFDAPLERTDSLKAFIVSDSHFGWRNPQQPKSEVIYDMISCIQRRFPELDVVIDTGDAHHGNATDFDRGQWTDIINGGVGTLPFFYVAGNHEITIFGGQENIELRCNRLGSVSCRPYYSFDIKGIHFVSLPELMNVSWISEEALAWAELDLSLNRDKTVIFLSHNSIRDTTLPHDNLAYRRLINSADIFNFLNRWPNVVAWMHGHNHTWEIVPKQGKFYVSNGRIGGFDPPYPGHFGKGHLGGIYLEITPDHFTVRGYSASKEKFFDELEHYAHLTQTMRINTSFDPQAASCVSHGVGNAADGERLPVYGHHTMGPQGSQELFITGADAPLINDNSEFKYSELSTLNKARSRYLPGYAVRPDFSNADGTDLTWDWLDPGIRLKKLDDSGLVRQVTCPGTENIRAAYFRVPPKGQYLMRLEVSSGAGGQSLQFECRVCDSKLNELVSLRGPEWTLKAGRQKLEHTFDISAITGSGTIYGDAAEDTHLNISVSANFSRLKNDVDLHRYEFLLAEAAGPTRNPVVTFSGKSHAAHGVFKTDTIRRFALGDRPSRRIVAETGAKGNRRLTWLVRQSGVQWQVRNAAVSDHGDWMEIGPMRNTFSQREEVIIVPLGPTQFPYVHRLHHFQGARVYPIKHAVEALRIEALAITCPEAQIDIFSIHPPVKVAGSDNYCYDEDTRLLKINILQPGLTEVTFYV